jgi:hypothetical protein
MEQNLIEDLIIESIKIYGVEVYYMPRKLVAVDDLLNEDDLSSFNEAYLVEMYIKNIDGFEGEGDFLSKFGLQIRDSMTLTVAQRTFNQEVNFYSTEIRPNEGDVLYFPLNNKMFEVQHVEHEAIFYQMGKLQTYDLRVELFEYSGERFSTEIPEIDNRYAEYDMTTSAAVANVESVSAFADNDTIEKEATTGGVYTADDILDFTETNPFGENEY